MICLTFPLAPFKKLLNIYYLQGIGNQMLIFCRAGRATIFNVATSDNASLRQWSLDTIFIMWKAVILFCLPWNCVRLCPALIFKLPMRWSYSTTRPKLLQNSNDDMLLWCIKGFKKFVSDPIPWTNLTTVHTVFTVIEYTGSFLLSCTYIQFCKNSGWKSYTFCIFHKNHNSSPIFCKNSRR